MDHWSQGSVVSGGVKIHYRRTGDGGKPPLILAHGFTDNGLCWHRTATALEADYDIVMVDARNHGQSGPGDAAIKELTADLAEIVNALGFDRSHVLGHSVGASIVAGFAASYPQLVSRLVLEDPPWTTKRGLNEDLNEDQDADHDKARLKKRREGFRQYVTSLAKQTKSEIISFGKKQHINWHDDEFPAWAELKKQVLPEAMDRLDLGDWIDQVPKIECPSVLIYGDNDGGFDGIVTPETARKVGAMNGNIRTHHVNRAGHNLRREQFEPFISIVRKFLSS